MKRRDFIAALGGLAATPLAYAQQGDRMPVVSILIGGPENPESRSRVEAFVSAFKQLGHTDNQNVRIDLVFTGGELQRTAALARDMVQRKPDVILAGPSNALIPLQRETRTIPIVFVNVSDPLRHGIIDRLSRPSGNVTGFTNLEHSLLGKWLQLLKEAAPRTKRVGLMIATVNAASAEWYRTLNEVAPTLAIEPIAIPFNERGEIEGKITSLARRPNSGLIVAGDSFTVDPAVRKQIIALTAAHRLPALYGVTAYAAEGGLISYGIDRLDPYRRAAGYIDRILKGEKPSDLPVQQPTKFTFAINLRTAKALGLELSPTFVGTADEVIE